MSSITTTTGSHCYLYVHGVAHADPPVLHLAAMPQLAQAAKIRAPVKTNEELCTLLALVGPVVGLKFLTDKTAGGWQKRVVLEFASVDAAKAAHAILNKRAWYNGRTLEVASYAEVLAAKRKRVECTAEDERETKRQRVDTLTLMK